MVIFKFSILLCAILMIYSHRAFSTEPARRPVRDGQVYQLSPEQLERINQEMGSGAIDEYGFPIRRQHEDGYHIGSGEDEQLRISGPMTPRPYPPRDESDPDPFGLGGFSAGHPHETQGLPRDYHDDLHDDNDYTAIVKKVWKF